MHALIQSLIDFATFRRTSATSYSIRAKIVAGYFQREQDKKKKKKKKKNAVVNATLTVPKTVSVDAKATAVIKYCNTT